MTKRMNKKIAMVLCFIMLFTLFAPIIISKAADLDYPEEDIIEEPYMFVQSANCSVSIISGTATVGTSVDGEYGTYYIDVTVYLEKRIDGEWQTVNYWTHSSGSNLTSSDTTSVSHGTYRVRMTVTAYNIGGCEEFDKNGNTVVY